MLPHYWDTMLPTLSSYLMGPKAARFQGLRIGDNSVTMGVVRFLLEVTKLFMVMTSNLTPVPESVKTALKHVGLAVSEF